MYVDGSVLNVCLGTEGARVLGRAIALLYYHLIPLNGTCQQIILKILYLE